MAALDVYNEKHNDIKNRLSTIPIPTDGSATTIFWTVGSALNISGTTVKNYLSGEIKDGYLAEAIYNEFRRLKLTK